MRIYVTTQGSSIIEEGGHLLVRCGKEIQRTIFLNRLSQLILCGNVSLTAPARNALFRNSIDTVFLTRNGRYLGRFNQPEPKNIDMRKRQFALSEDPEFTLSTARAIVAGKLANQAAVLTRLHRKHPDDQLAGQAGALRNIIGQLGGCSSIDELRGYEGQGSALYFAVFNRGFDQDQEFGKRIRRPPTDPVNAMLSLLYTFLYNQVYSAIRQAHLDPYLGNLHAMDYGRYSLALDLMEEFRPLLVDTLVFALFNLGVLKRDEDFICQEKNGEGAEEDGAEEEDALEDREDESSDGPERPVPVLLKPESLKKVIAQFERKMATSFTCEGDDHQITYSEALTRQARLYRLCVEDSENQYKPIAMVP